MRNIPTVTKNLLILNVLAFVAYIIFSGMGIDLNNLLGLHFFLSNDFHLWQLVTYMFMHGGYMHILMNMFMLWMFGMVMENVWGSKKFLLYYMVTGIGAGLCQELAQYATYMAEGLNHYQYVATEMGRMPMENYLSLWTTVGASGAVYGVLLALGVLVQPAPWRLLAQTLGHPVALADELATTTVDLATVSPRPVSNNDFLAALWPRLQPMSLMPD